MLQNFLAGFGGVGGACALITLLLRIWPGALDSLATGLYAHVQPERLPYDSPLSQHFAKTRQLGERTEKFDDRVVTLVPRHDQEHDHQPDLRRPVARPFGGRQIRIDEA